MKSKSHAYIHNFPVPSPKAHATYIVKSCEAAANLGYVSSLICPNRQSAKENIWKHYNISPDCFHLKKTYATGLWPEPIRKVVKDLAHPSASITFALEAVFQAWRNQIDTIQTGDPEVILVLSLLRWFYKPTVIYDIHLKPPSWVKSHLSIVSRFVVDAPYFVDWLNQNHVEEKKILYLPMGFDPHEYEDLPDKKEVKQKLGLPLDRLILGYIGRFETMGVEKGIFQLLEVANKLRKQVPLTVYLVGGPDSLADEYKKKANELGFTKKELIIRPAVLPHEVPQHVKACDIGWLVYPDNPRFRNAISPMKILENAAAGVPIIASDFPSITGIFPTQMYYSVHPDNQDRQINIVEKIMNTPEEVCQKCEAFKKFVAQYTWVNRQKQIFDSLLHKRDSISEETTKFEND